LDMTSYRINNLLDPSSTQDAATKSYVDTSIPVGGIIMWSGTTGTSLPSNWKLCDGSTYNSIKTPDLRGRFVLSSATPTSVNGSIALAGGLTARGIDASGGAETVKLTTAQMPTHGHGVSATTSGNDGDHAHTVSASGTPKIPNYSSKMLHYTNSDMNILSNIQGDTTTNRISVGTVDVTGSAANVASSYISAGGTRHGHTITVTQSDAGSGDPHSIMPPFYILAFIMRIS